MNEIIIFDAESRQVEVAGRGDRLADPEANGGAVRQECAHHVGVNKVSKSPPFRKMGTETKDGEIA